MINGDAQLNAGSIDDLFCVFIVETEIKFNNSLLLVFDFNAPGPRINFKNLSEDRFLRLVELSTRDASNSAHGAVNDSLVTVALAIWNS